MKYNIGPLDRVLRIVLGTALIGFGIYVAGIPGIAMGAVGFVPLITGLVGNCPAYLLFKINTCQSKNIKPA